jgi:hypothetical protein
MYAANRGAYLLLAEEGALPPEHRPGGRELPPKLAEYGLEGKLHHAVVRGRLVDASGAPVAGTVRLVQEVAVPLWFDGDGNNPTGQTSAPETVETQIDTDPDGSFAWHVNPSTRPFLREKGIVAPYQLTASSGSATATRELVCERGDIVELGDLTVRS